MWPKWMRLIKGKIVEHIFRDLKLHLFFDNDKNVVNITFHKPTFFIMAGYSDKDGVQNPKLVLKDKE